jgi:hypothetical protein
MAATKKDLGDFASSKRMGAVEKKFFAAIENPKPAPAHLREMFRLYGSGTTGTSSEGKRGERSGK